MDTLHQAVVALFCKATGKDKALVASLVEIPSREGQGDRAIPVFRFAKEEKASPVDLAKRWQKTLQALKKPTLIEKVDAQGGFINFHANVSELSKEVFAAIDQQQEKYGHVSKAQAEKVIVEYSSPNIAKPLSIGHLRSTNIGACLARIFAACGDTVTSINHLGDWGTQFGKLMVAYRKWGSSAELDKAPIDTLYKLYVQFHKEVEEDSSLDDQARAWFSKLEQGDEEAKDLWTWFSELTMKQLKNVYADMKVQFDHYWGESFYVDQLPELYKTLEEKNISSQSDGATVVKFAEKKLGVCVLKKQDASSLYIARDIAAAVYRKQKIDFDRMLYIVGTPQSLHFKQLFTILGQLGHAWSKTCEHINFGHLSFGDEGMSTRKGNVIFLQDVMRKAQELALAVIEEKNPELENKQEVAKQVSMGAILFADVSTRRAKDVKFSWSDILNFEGETGPYLQYTCVRMRSVQRRFLASSVAYIKGDPEFVEAEEIALLRMLSYFPLKLQKARDEREPFIVASHLIAIARAFNKFYAKHRILDAPPTQASSRMRLLDATLMTMKSGMELLAIPIPEKM